MDDLSEKVVALKDIFWRGSIKEIEEILSKINGFEDPKSIELLVSLFDDRYPYDECMFSIIHSIENFNDEIYAEHILNTIPDFIYKSPRWASIIHMRILNSETTKIAYIKACVKRASKEQKLAIKKLLDSIKEVNVEFLAKTIPLLEVL